MCPLARQRAPPNQTFHTKPPPTTYYQRQLPHCTVRHHIAASTHVFCRVLVRTALARRGVVEEHTCDTICRLQHNTTMQDCSCGNLPQLGFTLFQMNLARPQLGTSALQHGPCLSLRCNALHCIALLCIALHCFALHFRVRLVYGGQHFR